MSKHKFDLTITLDAVVEGGRADAEDLSDKIYDALVEAIEAIDLDGECAHATKDDKYVEWNAEVTEVGLGGD